MSAHTKFSSSNYLSTLFLLLLLTLSSQSQTLIFIFKTCIDIERKDSFCCYCYCSPHTLISHTRGSFFQQASERAEKRVAKIHSMFSVACYVPLVLKNARFFRRCFVTRSPLFNTHMRGRGEERRKSARKKKKN